MSDRSVPQPENIAHNASASDAPGSADTQANQHQFCLGDKPAPEASPTSDLLPEPAQHPLQAERSPRPGATRVDPVNPAPTVNTSAVSRTGDSANPNPTRPPAHGNAQPFVQNFLRSVFPPLSAPDIVRRFVDAGIVEHDDLLACLRLPERDQLEMLRADLGLNILHSRMVRAALNRV